MINEHCTTVEWNHEKLCHLREKYLQQKALCNCFQCGSDRVDFTLWSHLKLAQGCLSYIWGLHCICLSCSRGDSGCLEYGWEQPLVGFTLVYLCKWWDVWPQEQITLHDVGMSKIRQSDIAFFPTMGVKPCWRLEERVYLYLWCLKYYGMEGCLICFALNVLQRTVSFNYGTMKVHWRSSKCCYSQASSTYF